MMPRHPQRPHNLRTAFILVTTFTVLFVGSVIYIILFNQR